MCTVLEPFRKPDSSPWILSKDRFMEIYWNRQKASLWQEAMGNTHTGVHAHRNRGNLPGWPVGICLCLLFAFVPTFHFYLGCSCEACVPGVRSATQTEGLFILEVQSANLLEKEEAGQERNVLGNFVPSQLFSPLLQFFFCSRSAVKTDVPIFSTVSSI